MRIGIQGSRCDSECSIHFMQYLLSLGPAISELIQLFVAQRQGLRRTLSHERCGSKADPDSTVYVPTVNSGAAEALGVVVRGTGVGEEPFRRRLRPRV
jgi:hypothetical protein